MKMPSAAISDMVVRARERLDRARNQTWSTETLCSAAIELAETVHDLAAAHQSADYRARAETLSRMMLDRKGQVFTTQLTDRAHRSRSGDTTLSQARYLLDRLGTPGYLGPLERFQLGMMKLVGGLAPELARSKMLERIQRETSAYILSAEPEPLQRYLRTRAKEGVQVNVHHLGEEVLGEEEAERRVQTYLELLAQPLVTTISIKVSSIFSQLDPFAFEHSLDRIRDRLRPICRAALDHQRRGARKLVYLDMEAYRDMELTLGAYQRLLDEPEFRDLSMGCVLQAYLPDSYERQGELLAWGKERVAAGGQPIRLRIVKGANLAMERLESNHRGWALPVYPSKRDVDANFKRMVLRACEPEHAAVARVGIASHNLFDVCFALLVRAQRGVEEFVGFELLEGMADHLRHALLRLGADVLLYAPIVEAGEFPSAIAYLVRRLDENTAEENFLRHSFGMRRGDTAWRAQEKAFRAACESIEQVSSTPRRRLAGAVHRTFTKLADPFVNEPDTDFTQADNRQRVEQALAKLRKAPEALLRSQVPQSPPSRRRIDGFDPSLPDWVPYEIELATEATVERAFCNAEAAQVAWWDQGFEKRAQFLLGVGRLLRIHRSELTALMVSDGGKRVDEADTEVSEAIDFAEYYARTAMEVASERDVQLEPRGTIVVTPPWNFPLAIPLGGTLAALVMGNPVILKPALETPRVARRAAELCWQAGIPEDVLQFLVCKDQVGSRLIEDPRNAGVVLTGGTKTARLFQRLRPQLQLFAETGGKNALIVTPMADRELAIGDIAASAFGHAGQKCSALSLLVLHRELYDDERFLDTLRDAARSLSVGSAWDPSSRITPLIAPPNNTQRRALFKLDPPERWLLEPKVSEDNPRLVSPGIKLGVEPDSYSHKTEFFCPVLSVMRAENLEHAIELANATPYGLTSGIHTLDEREQMEWAKRILAGNLYVNRRITGAIVQRQPFGGWKASSFGPGAKAGGPNYVTQFVRVGPSEHEPRAESRSEPDHQVLSSSRWSRAIERLGDAEFTSFAARVFRRFEQDYERLYHLPEDHSQLLGQDNLLQYVPVRSAIWVPGSSGPQREQLSPERLARQLFLVLCAHWVTGAPHAVRIAETWQGHAWLDQLVAISGGTFFQREAELLSHLDVFAPERIRILMPLSLEVTQAAVARGLYVDAAPPVANGRFELHRTLREQALSVTYHRYGNLGMRELDKGSSRAA